MQDKYLKVTQVAALLNVHRSTVFRLVQRGELPKPYKIGSTVTRWKESEIQAYLSAARVTEGAA